MTATLLIVGLGPGSFQRTPSPTRDLLLDRGRAVVVRTLDHPASEQLARLREVASCDDLYLANDDFEGVYRQIADRVLAAAALGPTAYAVPGSPLIGELAVGVILKGASQQGIEVEVIDAESFVDAVLETVGYDPLDRGLRLLNGHRLPAPLVVDGPTLIAHLDHPVVLAEALAALERVVAHETRASLVVNAGSDDVRCFEAPLADIDLELAGPRTSLFVDPQPGGLVGAVRTMWRLREECPWDRRQTHSSLAKNLIEETFELVEAISDNEDGSAYGALEEELGDVLLQVLFHAAIARQAGAFDIDDVGEVLRQKLVRRHPHVFGTVEAETPEAVKSNWERIKAEERGLPSQSLLDGVPLGMPGLERAAKLQRLASGVGFDWSDAGGVFDKLDEELNELRSAVGSAIGAAVEEELGDLLFTVVNLARHLAVDPELALRRSIARFVDRFTRMEREGSLAGLSAAELDRRWQAAKQSEGRV